MTRTEAHPSRRNAPAELIGGLIHRVVDYRDRRRERKIARLIFNAPLSDMKDHREKSQLRVADYEYSRVLTFYDQRNPRAVIRTDIIVQKEEPHRIEATRELTDPTNNQTTVTNFPPQGELLNLGILLQTAKEATRPDVETVVELMHAWQGPV